MLSDLEKLIKKVETGGVEFGKGRLMELEASDGMFALVILDGH